MQTIKNEAWEVIHLKNGFLAVVIGLLSRQTNLGGVRTGSKLRNPVWESYLAPQQLRGFIRRKDSLPKMQTAWPWETPRGFKCAQWVSNICLKLCLVSPPADHYSFEMLLRTKERFCKRQLYILQAILIRNTTKSNQKRQCVIMMPVPCFYKLIKNSLDQKDLSMPLPQTTIHTNTLKNCSVGEKSCYARVRTQPMTTFSNRKTSNSAFYNAYREYQKNQPSYPMA